MKKIIFALGLAALIPSASLAGRPLSDVELRAAYCIGRLDGPPLDPNKYPESFRPGISKLNDEVGLSLYRLKSYLAPKEYLDTDALLYAVAQGKVAQEDAGACMVSPKSERCAYLAKDVSGCRNPDFLPF